MDSMPPNPPRAKKSNTGLIIGIILGVSVCCIGPIVLGVGGFFFALPKMKGYTGCATSIALLASSVEKYSQANKGKLPTANKWMDQVRPYYKKAADKLENFPFPVIKPDGEWACVDDAGNKTGIAFNSDLSEKNLADIKDQVAAVVIFEVSKPGKNLAMKYVPQDKAGSPKAFGQPRGWFTATLDGTVKAGNTKFTNKTEN